MYSPDIVSLIIRVKLDIAKHFWKVSKNIPPSLFSGPTFSTTEYSLLCPQKEKWTQKLFIFFYWDKSRNFRESPGLCIYKTNNTKKTILLCLSLIFIMCKHMEFGTFTTSVRILALQLILSLPWDMLSNLSILSFSICEIGITISLSLFCFVNSLWEIKSKYWKIPDMN